MDTSYASLPASRWLILPNRSMVTVKQDVLQQ
jgi:hypothetical protein